MKLLARTGRAFVFAASVIGVVAIGYPRGLAQQQPDADPVSTPEASTRSDAEWRAPSEDGSAAEDSHPGPAATPRGSEDPSAGDGPATKAGPAQSKPAEDSTSETQGHGTVQVIVKGRGDRNRWFGSGFVVAPNRVVTAAHLVEKEDRISVVHLSGDGERVELVASVRHLSKYAGLALLATNGLDMETLPLANDGFEEGRTVISSGFWIAGLDAQNVPATPAIATPQRAKGAVGEYAQLPPTADSPSVDLILHNAMIPAPGYGGPLLNDCGEVVGVNRGSPEYTPRRLRRGEAPDGVVHATSVAAIVGLLEPVGVPFIRAETHCADPRLLAQADADRERARADEQARRVAELGQQAAHSEARVADKQAELDRARKERDEKSARVDKLSKDLEEAERAGAAGTESLKADLENARSEKATAQQRVDGLEGEIETLKRLVEQRERNLLITVAIAALSVGLLGVVTLSLYRHRTRKSDYVQSGPVSRQRGSEDPGGTNVPDHLFTGITSDGKPVRLKVPGSMVMDGVVIGRSPRNATFLIDDKTLSREHARLSATEGELRVEDLDTTNGTRLSGRKVGPKTPVVLRDGDVLELGGVKLRVELSL